MFELESELATLALLLTLVGAVLPVGAPQAANIETQITRNKEYNPDLYILTLPFE